MSDTTVLVAALNNAPFIGELLDSVLAQSYGDIEVLVRDDGSVDDTRSIVAACGDSRLRLLPPGPPSGSAQNNFYLLMEQTDSDYVMFADADDVWLPDKIQKTRDTMLALEQRYGRDCPLLVHTDLRVVDEKLDTIAPSLFRYEKLSPGRTAFKQLLVQNNVTGCTVLINRALHRLVPHKPAHSVMHDWWLALAASAFGHIGVVDEPLILYRQHGGNQVGAYDARDLSAAAKKLGRRAHMRTIYDAMYDQAGCFADTFADQLSPQDLRDARSYAAMKDKNKLGKIGSIIKNGFYKNTLLRNIGQLWAV